MNFMTFKKYLKLLFQEKKSHMVPHDDDELIYLSQNEFVQLNNDLGKVQCLKKQTEKNLLY